MKHIEGCSSILSTSLYQQDSQRIPKKVLNPGLLIKHAKEEIQISKQILIQVDAVLSYSVVHNRLDSTAGSDDID